MVRTQPNDASLPSFYPSYPWLMPLVLLFLFLQDKWPVLTLLAKQIPKR